MKQQYVASNFDLHRGNQVYATDQAKADAFAEAFAKSSNSENLPADMRQFRREREAVYSDPVADHNAHNASHALNVIKVLSTQPWANPPKVLVSLMRSLVRS